MSEIKFTSQINGGQGEFAVQLSLPINYGEFGNWDILKLFFFDDNNKTWKLIYTWIISRFARVLEASGEYIEVVCIWLSTLLSRVFYRDWELLEFNKTQDPSFTIKDSIDHFNRIYPSNLFSYDWVDTFWEDLSIDFSWKKCIDVLNDIQKITSTRFYYIGCDWNVVYKDTLWELREHRLKIENQVDSLFIDEEIEGVQNKIYSKYSWDTVWPYWDSESQLKYWIIENRVSSTAWDEEWAELFWEELLKERKSEKRQTMIVVNNKYEIESINPWDKIVLLNTTYSLPNLIVQKVVYKQNKATLYLEKYQTFAESVLSSKD